MLSLCAVRRPAARCCSLWTPIRRPRRDESALARRFGPDYRVLAVGTPHDALTRLQRLADHGGEVALVAADLRLPGMDGVDFLERAHALHPGSWRVLLVAMDRYHTRIPFTELARFSARPRWGGSISRW